MAFSACKKKKNFFSEKQPRQNYEFNYEFGITICINMHQGTSPRIEIQFRVQTDLVLPFCDHRVSPVQNRTVHTKFVTCTKVKFLSPKVVANATITFASVPSFQTALVTKLWPSRFQTVKTMQKLALSLSNWNDNNCQIDIKLTFTNFS